MPLNVTTKQAGPAWPGFLLLMVKSAGYLIRVVAADMICSPGLQPCSTYYIVLLLPFVERTKTYNGVWSCCATKNKAVVTSDGRLTFGEWVESRG